jgi:hypothetical protein
MPLAAVNENCVIESQVGKVKRFEINRSAFSQWHCHIIFPLNPELLPSEEHLIITALEYITFHPDSRGTKEYHMSMINCDELLLGVCSVPVGLIEVCRRAGAFFNMTMSRGARIIAAPSCGLEVIIPNSEQLLIFKGDRCRNNDYLEQELVRVKAFGDWLQSQTLD